jgi:transcriptional regulator with XRE-family HTH domain
LKLRAAATTQPSRQSLIEAQEAGAHRTTRTIRDHIKQIGDVIREAREGRYSLEGLSARSGVSAGLISQIERGRGNPTLGTLIKLSHALGISINSFYEGPDVDRRMVVTKDKRKHLNLPREKLTYEMLSPDSSGPFTVALTRIKRGYNNSDEPFTSSGTAFCTVLTGRLELNVGSTAFDLKSGDSITFDGSEPHYLKNVGAEAQIIWVADRPIV